MAIGRRQRQHLGGDVPGQALAQAWAVGDDHLDHAGDLRGGQACFGGVRAGHQDVHLAAACRGSGDGVERRGVEGEVVVFSNDEYGFLRNPGRTRAVYRNASDELTVVVRRPSQKGAVPQPCRAGGWARRANARRSASCPAGSGSASISLPLPSSCLLPHVLSSCRRHIVPPQRPERRPRWQIRASDAPIRIRAGFAPYPRGARAQVQMGFSRCICSLVFACQ